VKHLNKRLGEYRDALGLDKIARLTVADVELDAGEVRLRLGTSEAVPIIPPFSTVLLDHIATRSNQTTATNPASTLLFPGRRAGQPIHPGSLRLRLHRLGSPTSTDAPAPSATCSSRPHPRSAPACSATTRPALRSSRPRPARLGSATRQAITLAAASRGGVNLIAEITSATAKIGSRTRSGITPNNSPPTAAPVIDPAIITTRNRRFARSTAKLLSRLYREGDHHRWQRHQQRQAPCGLDVDTVGQHDRRDQQHTTGHPMITATTPSRTPPPDPQPPDHNREERASRGDVRGKHERGGHADH
jgi:hypothetical protein